MKNYILFLFIFFSNHLSFAKNTDPYTCENFFKENAQLNLSKNQRLSIIPQGQKYINIQPQDSDILNTIKNLLNQPEQEKYNFRLKMVDNDSITVVAVPDGEIIINESFWRTLSIDEKFFTIAHELGHIVMQHSCKYYIYIHTNMMKNESKKEKSTMNIDNYMFSHPTIYNRLAPLDESQEIAADNFAFEILNKINFKITNLDMLLEHQDTPESRKINIIQRLPSI